ncbi:hypothetical protein Taro_028684 [Colocasia esculenta]|uniref:Uncharacterized protein n=1 Tax=Colocasia esculenta TaxID=4460 RepID=A0A843VSL8_COLES|nr:hypothetical protein [Colocasia esculenta]
MDDDAELGRLCVKSSLLKGKKKGEKEGKRVWGDRGRNVKVDILFIGEIRKKKGRRRGWRLYRHHRSLCRCRRDTYHLPSSVATTPAVVASLFSPSLRLLPARGLGEKGGRRKLDPL